MPKPITISADPSTDDGRDFYVSIISSCGRKSAMLLGPFAACPICNKKGNKRCGES